MMRAVMRGDAAEALRWRRVQQVMDEVEAETDRMTERQDARIWHARNRREAEEQALRDATDPDRPDSSDGVFESASSTSETRSGLT